MAYVDLAELKSVLGIGNIYADSVVQEVADSATNIVDPYLLHNRYGITHHQREGTTAILYAATGTDVYVGRAYDYGQIKLDIVTTAECADSLWVDVWATGYEHNGWWCDGFPWVGVHNAPCAT